MSTITYIVKVASGKFTIDDAVAPKLTFRDGDTYVFDQSDNSNSGHILQFSATSNNSGSSEYTTGVTKTGTAGSSGAKTTIVTSGSTTDTLYYYSSGGGDHGSEFSNSGFKTSSNFNFLKPIIGGANTAEKWGSMVNHAIDQIDQNISAQDLDGATDSGTVAVDLDTQSLTVAGSNGIATSGSGQTITISGEALAYQGEPHIIPNVLYPAVAGKDLSGTALGGSYTYGTAHTDGRSYYYTDIKGSKPIKDPRIGAHFGSQRHKFKSLQLLEQETATHGTNTYSIDGREWCRVVGNPIVFNGDGGNCIQSNETGSVTPAFFVEIVGYFNDFNCISRTSATRVDDINVTVNGTATNSADTDKLGGRATANSPLRNRYVDMGSVINHGDSTVATNLGTTPKINTIKLEAINTGSEYWQFFGVELIAQDTTSTANRSKIQIPSQNVVSYGKKFTVSGTPHYDPFNGFVNDTTLFSSVVDTATSLGLGTATTWGAPWDKGSNNHIRPFNGGRVVKWVDSSGNIKTSVTMMPANAQNLGTTDSNEITTASATNSHTINFSDDAIDHSLSEVAKTFYIREFGNGGANQGTGGTYADASMVGTGVDDIAYVMDDGLTSIAGDDVNVLTDMVTFNHDANGDYFYFTFIGTGVGITVTSNGAGTDEYDKYIDGVKIVDGAYARTSGVITQETLAQNLPYGTHILKLERTAVDAWNEGYSEITFYQPKKPPIPEEAVILADYMLMADYVGVPSSDSGQQNTIPKGTRMCNASRDIFYNTASGTIAFAMNGIGTRERTMRVQYNDISASSKEGPLITYFGHPKMSYGMASDTDASPKYELKIADSTTNVTGVTTSGSVSGANVSGFKVDGTSYQHISSSKSDGTLGSQTAQIRCDPDDSNDNHLYFCDAYIPTPIHTSSHYQTFETPFLNELVGGDRNMEQTNLVVTPDGKTWDEVTRKTDYLGATASFAIGHPDAGNNTGITTSSGASGSLLSLFTNRRGVVHAEHNHNKGIIMAYDRWMVKEDGWYRVSMQMRTLSGTEMAVAVYKNDIVEKYYFVLGNNNDHSGMNWSHPFYMKIGETWNVRIVGGTFRNQYDNYSSLSCVKVERS